ncbi:protein kinase domain-containing protein [Nodosilinea sp. PGN35]|uniref:protein kinase domain-containing protein n=1 Tax=Nodosilinea sp. PGN35 TaxID=3020489 RepID=UPI00398ABA66
MVSEFVGGRYKIIRVLGQGGFGKTYLAADQHRPTTPVCVVKQLRAPSNDTKMVALANRLFAREAETLEKLGNHPQIPLLLAYFIDNQQFYIVQEFIEGNTLADELHPSTVKSEAEVVHLLREVLDILAFVHGQGVIHRDLKPDNLIRRTSDKSLVLIDFGATKELPGQLASSLQPGQEPFTIAIGTTGYAPVEQLRGRPRFSSDLFALGMIAIQALTGSSPQDLEEDAESGETLWLDKANISPPLQEIVNKMVRYHFRDRYQSSADILQDLNRAFPITGGAISMPSLPPQVTSAAPDRESMAPSCEENPEPPESNEQYLKRSPNRKPFSTVFTALSQVLHGCASNNTIQEQPPICHRDTTGRILIRREQAQRFQELFATSLSTSGPVVFHVYGIGGVGKSTLLRDLTQQYAEQASFATLSFDLSLGVESPLELMATLYETVLTATKPGFWQQEVLPGPDPFLSLYERYQETLYALETQPAVPGEQVTDAQINSINRWAKWSVKVFNQLIPLPSLPPETLEQLTDASIEASTFLLAEKDRWQRFLQQHRATRQQRGLQRLMIDPLPLLTKAFVEALIHKAKKRPLVLVLDTYEKASPEINNWCWRYLLANTDLRQHPIRLLIASRHRLSQVEGWRRLQQNLQLVYETSLGRLDEKQTHLYLSQLNVHQPQQLQSAFRQTKGLPYFLNWIREQTEQGIEVDFSQGSDEIAKVLLQGLQPHQKRLVQLAACCRWFNRPLLQYLIEAQNPHIDFEQAVDAHLNCFDWLIQRDFIKVSHYRFHLEDVARDTFRLSLWQDSPQLFRQTHGLLAQYFKNEAARRINDDTSIKEKINHPEWRTYTTEVFYHQSFSQEGHQQVFTDLIAEDIFQKSEIVQTVVTAINAEASIEHHPLLAHEAKTFWTTIQPNPEV